MRLATFLRLRIHPFTPATPTGFGRRRRDRFRILSIRFALCAALPALTVSCASLNALLTKLLPGSGAASGGLELVISARHRQDFAVFTTIQTTDDDTYAGPTASIDDRGTSWSIRALEPGAAVRDPETIDAVFRTLDLQSDAYCGALFSRRPFQPRDLVLLNPDYHDEYTRNRHPDSLHSLRAGCRNFFEMNDLRPDRDFALVRAIYPESRFDCYSVGLLQPYIMHGILGCRSLTFIDINWRILEMHRALLRRAQAGAFAAAETVNAELSGLQLKFPALHARPTRPRPARIQHLCRPIQHEFCLQILPEFRSAFEKTPARRLRLNLSTLHAGAYESHGAESGEEPSAATRVIYLSNAIEESYTSRAEFEALLQNLNATAATGRAEPALDVLIHHVGGWKLFGLYEIRHANAGPEGIQIRTICKDTYLSMSRRDDPKKGPVEYLTHFERRQSESKNNDAQRAPACSGLYAEMAD
ncbi:MAG: hypothetical protein RIF32_02350 [Leptospirales bacterium]